MAAGLGWVGVHQGHRRRGLLTSMMHDHFERSLARGEIVTTLFAAEPAIYQRFGYGLACPALSLSLGRGAGLRELEGSDKLPIELADADLSLHADTVIAVLTREGRPGTPMDLPEDLRAFLFLDIESWRNGQEKMRIAIVRDEHGPAAFATFARKSKWDAGGPSGTTTVHQWAAATPEATRRLFSVLSDLDLVGTTTVTNIPMDHPLLHLLVDVRAPQPRRFDNLWVRLLDVPRALEARGYRDSADFTMRVTDPRLAQNDGVWRVRIDDGNPSVTRSDAQPDLAISVQDLSAAYLGGVTLSELARSGLVAGDAAAIAAASEALRGDVAPVSAINF
jgi:predicted acetyltransferase